MNSKKKISLIVLTAVMVFFFAVMPASAAIIYVGPSEAETTIQGAVNNATAGDTIIVREGTYNENVDVTKSLTIRSTSGNPEDTIVQAWYWSDHVFNVSADWVTISGFTVTGITPSHSDFKKAGIYLDNVNHCNISYNNASGYWQGIVLHGSSNNCVTNNSANANKREGIVIGKINSASNHNIITNNTVNSNYYGIRITASKLNTLRNNTMNNNDRNFNVEFMYNHDINTSNKVNGKPIYYLPIFKSLYTSIALLL